MLRFLTGEHADAPTLREFNHASGLVGAGAATPVLAPALVALAAEEAALLAFAGRVTARRVVQWALANPAAALAASEALLGFGVQIGEDGWDAFWGRLQDPHGRWFVVAQILMDFMHVKSATAGHDAAPSVRRPSLGGAAPVPDVDAARQQIGKARAVVRQVHDGASSDPQRAASPPAREKPLVSESTEAPAAAKSTPTASPAAETAVKVAPGRELGLRQDAMNALRSLENVKTDPIGDVNSQPNHNHYAAARREAAGEVVARRPHDGRPYSHIGDLQRSYDALSTIRATLR